MKTINKKEILIPRKGAIYLNIAGQLEVIYCGVGELEQLRKDLDSGDLWVTVKNMTINADNIIYIEIK